MNRVELIGRLTNDAELRYTPGSGNSVTTFNLAVNDGFGDKQKAYFIPVVVWGKSAEAVANYTKKGTKVAVTGKITTRSYEAKDGTKRYVTEVVAEMYGGIEFLDSKSESQGQNNNQGYQSYTAQSNNDFNGGNFEEDLTPVDDGDMPF
jgi:single-strand DNA-binding protein